MPPGASLDDLAGKLSELDGRLATFRAPEALGERFDLQGLLGPCRNLQARLDEGAEAAIRIAFFGPTGAGKSKIFNSVLGEMVSPAGFIRPFTRVAVHYAHEDLRRFLDLPEEEVRWHSRADWRRRILIDTPDFDGVEDPNHAVAERIYASTDVLIFLADVHKYADATTWKYIRRLHRDDRQSIFVINKLRDDDPREDFESRLRDLFGTQLPEVIGVQHHALSDAETIPGDDSGLSALRERLDSLAASRREVLSRSFAGELEYLSRSWADFSESFGSLRASTARVGERVESAFQAASRRLGELSEARLDPALKEKVYQEVLAGLEKVDLLRYPRQLLALPFKGAKALLGRFLPGVDSESAPAARAADPGDADSNLPALESAVMEFTEQVTRALEGESEIRPATDLASWRLEHDELVALYRERREAYRDWAQEEARRLASELAGEHKLKFALSQVLFNSVLIGIQLKTGGVLTLTELLADGVLSPLAAKLVGMAISSEQVKAYEDSARQRHRDLLIEVLAVARARCDERLEALRPRLDGFEETASEMSRLEDQRARWVALYEERLRGEPALEGES